MHALSALRKAVERARYEWVPKCDPNGRCWWLKRSGRALGTILPSSECAGYRAVFYGEASSELDGLDLREAALWLLDKARDEDVHQGITGAQRRALSQLRDLLEAELDDAQGAERNEKQTHDLAFFLGGVEAFLEGGCQLERLRSCARRCKLGPLLDRTLRGAAA
jgi:hypothetical protein